MADTAPSEGQLNVDEGTIYWRYDKSHSDSNNSRPVLVFAHATVSDHTVWDAQVDAFTKAGWDCLRYDHFAFHKSHASKAFLAQDPRPAVDHVQILEKLISTVVPAGRKVVLLGLSFGGGVALFYSIRFPALVAGLAILAGGVPGFEIQNDPREDEMDGKIAELTSSGDVKQAAEMNVRFWGDGPLQAAGRLPAPFAKRMLGWTLDSSAREAEKTGGSTFVDFTEHPTLQEDLGKLRIPTAVGYGVFDETYTTSSMKEIASKVPGAWSKEFQTAHMVPLEAADEATTWLKEWLDSTF